MQEYDTIAAIITAQGLGAMGALRISGPAAFDVAAKVFRSQRGRRIEDLAGYSLTYGHVFSGEECLDQALLLKMAGPYSFTGEDVAELQCHGGPFVLSRLFAAVLAAGARGAEPGEFSKRAFLNGKLDLSQAEAIMDLVSASNQIAASAAVEQLEGSLSRQIKKLRDQILNSLARIEAEIDFPDEDLTEGAVGEIKEKEQGLSQELAELSETLSQLLEEAQFSRIYREGLRLVFYGKPNAGKSSLLNALLQEPRAIVTAEPGTTRDTLEERILLRGIPLILTDTAGIRQADSPAEQAGIQRAQNAVVDADLVLFVMDVTEGLDKENSEILKELSPERTLIILNKSDLLGVEGKTLPWLEKLQGWHWCLLSALAADSMEILSKQIQEHYQRGSLSVNQKRLMLNSRQLAAVMEAHGIINEARTGAQEGTPEDLLSIDLRRAWTALGKITGETVEEALVTEIFSRFCLGK